jgi:alcohol dehydrogenase
MAIVDPALTVGIPPVITVQTGIDAFSHCFESYTSMASIPVSELFAIKGMELGVKYLPMAVKDGSNMEAREALSLAALYAPMAFNDASIHIGHGFAHCIGAATHVTHGTCCAISTSICLEYLAEAVPEKIKHIGRILGAQFDDAQTPAKIGAATRKAWDGFCKSLGIPTTLSDAGIDESDILKIVKLFEGDISQGLSPRKATGEEALALLKQAY